MELSSIVHYMNESFQYKFDEHQYLIKIKTKKNDFKKVTFYYCEKYLLERKMPELKIFSKEMRKVMSTEYFDYYEVIFSDLIEMMNVIIPMLACRYYFLFEDDNKKIYYGNYKFYEKEPKESMDMFNLVIHQADCSFFKTPEWSKGAVVYQIFPERFSPTDDKYSSNWFITPMNHKERTNGTLKGIIQKIPYLKDLGIDAIYMTPIFQSNSSHRYDTIDYMVIDPRLGTDEDLLLLVNTCHENGIKVILDIVFNHCSVQFFAFQDLLKNQEKSRYKDWFFVREFPIDLQFPAKYMGFSFTPFMPKLNSTNEECSQYLLNVIRHYLSKFNVDGFRLDVADEVSHKFWKKFHDVCKSYNKDCLIMGEVWYDSTPYLRGDEFDSIMNYTVFDSIRKLLNNEINIENFFEMIGRERGEMSLTYYHNSNILIGSHDTDRIYHFLNHNKDKFILAMSLLLTLPGAPIIYYGDEKMMDGEHDPDCRRGMIFDENYNKDIANLIKKLIKIKHLDPIKKGEINLFQLNEHTGKIVRFNDKEKISIIFTLDKECVCLDLKGKVNLLDDSVFDGTLKENKILIYKE